MLMCSLHHSPSDQVQHGRTFVKYIVFERTFSVQNNGMPAIAGVVNMAIIRNVLNNITVASEPERRFHCQIFRTAVSENKKIEEKVQFNVTKNSKNRQFNVKKPKKIEPDR